MSKRWIKAGQIDQTIDLFILDSSSTTGAGLTGLTSGSSGLTCYYRKGATGTAQALTLASQTVGGAHTDGGFVAIDGTNMPGLYRLDLSDTMVAAEGMLTILLKGATNMAPVVAELEIVDIDIYDSVRLGLTALPNAAAEASGGLATLSAAQSSNGTIPANMVAISGDVTAADNLETAADGGVYNLGGGGIVASSVTGAVGSVTGNVGGNVTGSVNSVTTGVSLAANSVNTTSIQNGAITAIKIQDGAITNLKLASGAISSSTFATDAITSTVIATDAITSAELASSSINEIADAVWSANYATSSGGSAWANNTFGDRVVVSDSNNQNEVAITGSKHIAADIHEIQPDEIIDIAQGVLTEATSTTTYAAGDVGNVLGRLVNMIEADGANFRYTTNALEQAPTGGGGSTFVTGNLPYRVKADEQFPGGVVDINIGTLMRLDLQIVDRDDNPINLTGGTVTVGVRNASTGATVGTDQSATLSLARLGYIYVDTVADWSATAGTYRITVSATLGSDVIVAGPLQLVVRTR